MADRGTSSRRERVLFIGWDAADAALVDRWCADGLLPNLARMRSRGTSARMGTTADVFHVSAWPSIFTGTTADKHGLYHAYVTPPGHLGLARPRPDSTPFPFLWRLLSDRGKRCVIVDAFMTCPLRPFNGVQITDWGSWSWFWEPTITPNSLEAEVRAKFGAYPAEDHSKIGFVPPTDFSGFLRRLLAGVRKKTEVVKWLMAREDWDFFLVVFGESHPAGHYFWQFHDSTFPVEATRELETLRDALRDVYVALDHAVGELLHAAGEDTTTVVASGDGMGANYSGSHIVPDLLGRMRLLHDGSRSDGASTQQRPEAGGTLLGNIRNMIPKSVRMAVSNALLSRAQQEKLSLHFKTAGIAWNRTRAYQIENANEGYIRVNLKGREPEGIVEPGPDYDALCDELHRTLQGLVNPANGERAVAAVHKTQALFQGPRRGHLPDVVVCWNMDARVTTELQAEQYGIARSAEPSWRLAPYYTGNHHPNAFAVATGPDVPEGVSLEGAHILDLAPTLLLRFGIDPPDYMDGRPLGALTSPGVTGWVR